MGCSWMYNKMHLYQTIPIMAVPLVAPRLSATHYHYAREGVAIIIAMYVADISYTEGPDKLTASWRTWCDH